MGSGHAFARLPRRLLKRMPKTPSSYRWSLLSIKSNNDVAIHGRAQSRLTVNIQKGEKIFTCKTERYVRLIEEMTVDC